MKCVQCITEERHPHQSPFNFFPFRGAEGFYWTIERRAQHRCWVPAARYLSPYLRAGQTVPRSCLRHREIDQPLLAVHFIHHDLDFAAQLEFTFCLPADERRPRTIQHVEVVFE